MKKHSKTQLYRTTALAIAMLCAPPTHAVSPTYKHQFTLGVDAMNYKYEEQTADNPKFMSLKSYQYGLNGIYKFTYNDWLFIQPEAKVNYGFAKYSNKWKPQFQATAEPTLLFEARLLGGVEWHVTDDLTLSPFTGVGFRFRSEEHYMIQDVDNNNQKKSKRVNQSWYIPLGIKANYAFTDTWYVNASAEYDFYLGGKHYVYSQQTAPSPLLMKQTKGYGVKGELLIGKQFEKVAIAFGPYVNYWKVNKTRDIKFTSIRRNHRGNIWPTETTSYEPRNTTTEVGLKLNFTF